MEENKRTNKRAYWLNIIIVVVLIGGATIYSLSGRGPGNPFEMREDGIVLREPAEFERAVQYADVASIEYRETFDRGSCVTGESGRTYTYGTWENGEFGQYTLHVLTKVDCCIVLTETDGDVVVFNVESAETTEQMASSLKEYMIEQGYRIS